MGAPLANHSTDQRFNLHRPWVGLTVTGRPRTSRAAGKGSGFASRSDGVPDLMPRPWSLRTAKPMNMPTSDPKPAHQPS